MADKEIMEKDNKDTQTEKAKLAGKFDSVEQLEKAYQEAQKLITKVSQEKADLKKSLFKTVSKDDTDYSKVEEEFYDKPVEVLQKFKMNIKQEVREELKEEEAQEMVWNDFFAKHKVPAALQPKIRNDALGPMWPLLEGKTQEEQFETIAKEWNPFLAMSTATKEAGGQDSYEDTDLDSARGRSYDSGAETSKASPSEKPSDMLGMLKKQFG